MSDDMNCSDQEQVGQDAVDVPDAVRCLERACSEAERNGDLTTLAASLIELGSMHLRMRDPDAALPFLDRGHAISKEHGMVQIHHRSHECLLEHSKMVGDKEEALYHFEAADRIERESRKKEADEKMVELRTRFEAERLLREEAIRKRHDIVQAVIDAQEFERSRIARDLHDGLGQMLAAVQMNLEHCRTAALRGTDVISLEAAIDHTAGVLSRTVDDMQAICHSLGSGTLREAGLIVALEELLGGIASHKQTRFEFVVAGVHDRLSEALEAGLFRIAQELVTNIVRHARAREATIQIVRTDEEIRLTVEDNGAGFDVRQQSSGMGRSNIAARATALGGHVTFDSMPGHGTTVSVVVPALQ